MERARPRLEVVSGGAASAGDPAREPAPPARGRGPLVWLLAVLLAFALLGLILESRRAVELTARVEGLSAELSAAEASLRAHESHLGQVRDSVAGLEASLADLRELVSRDPAARDSEAP